MQISSNYYILSPTSAKLVQIFILNLGSWIEDLPHYSALKLQEDKYKMLIELSIIEYRKYQKMMATPRTECCTVRALLARSVVSSVAASGVQHHPTGESDLSDRAMKSTLDSCQHDINLHVI